MTPTGYRLAIACLILLPPNCLGEPLLWGYSPSDPPPYVQLKGNDLQPSLTREIGEAAAAAAGREVSFVATPNNRIDEALASGRIDIICNTLPEWLSEPNQLLWTESLYDDADVVITRQTQPAPHSLADLQDAIVGTTLGYHYSDSVADAFNRQAMIRHDVRDLPTRLRMLERERLDAVIDLRRAVEHLLPDAQSAFHISSWEVERFALRCSLGNPQDSDSRKLAALLNEMIASGEIRQIVERFE